MTSISFQSVVKGDSIVIPPEYRGSIPPTAPVSVIVELESSPVIHTRTKKGGFTSSDFSAVSIDTKNWKFNREEANDR
jgi:hypothetical protein